MEINDLLKRYCENFGLEKPPDSVLINEIIECRAKLKDSEVNNKLLEELVFKYANAEKKLKQLNRELIWQQKRIQEDLVAAADIQKSLLPQKTNISEHLDVAWYFEPCDKIGGDIFNMTQLDNDHWAIYMLDVSGHGVPAAMVTVSVSQLMQLHTGFLIKEGTKSSPDGKIMSPAEVLNALDQEFPFDRFNNFFTINYFILNTKTGVIKYANAGHPKPVILRTNGLFEQLTASGPPIGTRDFRLTDDEIIFKEAQARIYPGDKVILYTDGLVEYHNQNYEFYGYNRFYDTMMEFKKTSVSDIVYKLIKSLKAFGNNANPADDITLLAIELK
ncbi:MAG: serine/threonine-protein phosphatase [Desulfobacterales bacterium]|nr:MAG: serine/threonine-protein phosphatase [Desulfobacterales bacterium]